MLTLRYPEPVAPWQQLLGAAASAYAGAMMAPADPTPHAADDARDITQALAGDDDAFERIVCRHQDAIARQMWRFTRQGQEHRQLVHDVFVEAFLSLKSFRGRSPFIHWLRKIATRVGYRLWRDRERDKARRTDAVHTELTARIANGPDSSEPMEAAEVVHLVLNRLPPRDRLVLTLMYLDEKSVAEAAAETGWSKAMVKVQAWRARKKFQKILIDLGFEEESYEEA
jgi:RNA polymerase sigma-70 factor, ECF subfamily